MVLAEVEMMEFEQIVECWNNDFINPTEENPMRVEEFLRRLDLNPVLSTLKEMYKEEYRFKYPMDAMLRTMIYFKLKRYNLSFKEKFGQTPLKRSKTCMFFKINSEARTGRVVVSQKPLPG